ncbi:MAG: PASTA domain-containing protein [Balneolaceae bacterium]|nr:PASTA domain-containing protein [Balneolaceae bacterium]
MKGSGNWVIRQHPRPGSTITRKQEITIDLGEATSDSANTTTPEGYARIPDVGGLDMRRASTLVNSHGFEIKMIGSGTVYTQFPRPGDLMKKGRTITVRGKAKSLETLAGG